jgi:hypothetical protein
MKIDKRPPNNPGKGMGSGYAQHQSEPGALQCLHCTLAVNSVTADCRQTNRCNADVRAD